MSPQSEEPLVSVIILNWNGKQHLEECLLSLKRQTYKNFEVILVDNGSTDGSVNYIRYNFGDFVKLIENKDNLGFAEGNNVGIRNSSGKYILLLNNDTKADPLWIEELVKVAESDEKIGMCASKVLSLDNPKTIDNVGHLIYKDGLNRGRGRLEYDRGQYDHIEEVFLPSGCAALYRKKMLNEIGEFDKDFFAYGDDTDIGIRGRLAGWKCMYAPTAIVYHKYSGSTSPYSLFKAFHAERNRLWIAIKYFPLPVLLCNPYYTVLRTLLQFYGALTHKGAAGKFRETFSWGKLFFALLKAYFSAIKGLPRMWEKRGEIDRLRRVSKKEINSWFKKFGIGVVELALKE
ncbi:hypothetical protein ES702_00083 [subsurface metagenome]